MIWILSVAEVLNTILFPFEGVNTALPDASNELPLVTVTFPLKVEIPATSRVLPNVVAPVPTEKVLEPVTDVLPFKETLPVPVENVYAPTCVMLLLKVLIPLTVSAPPSVVRPVPTVNVFAPVTDVFPFRIVNAFILRFPTPLRGLIVISPVVSPPIVNVLNSVVWIDLGAPARVRLPDIEAAPVVVRFVNVAAAGVVAPITVPLIPVAVTLIFAAPTNRSFPPN